MRHRPRSVATPAEIRVLCALVRVYDRDGRATARDVADVADRSLSTTHLHLRRLRDAGLCEWRDGSSGGTLRPLVHPVRFG